MLLLEVLLFKVLFLIFHYSINAGAKNIVCYTEETAIERFIKSRFPCTRLKKAQIKVMQVVIIIF